MNQFVLYRPVNPKTLARSLAHSLSELGLRIPNLQQPPYRVPRIPYPQPPPDPEHQLTRLQPVSLHFTSLHVPSLPTLHHSPICIIVPSHRSAPKCLTPHTLPPIPQSHIASFGPFHAMPCLPAPWTSPHRSGPGQTAYIPYCTLD